MRNLTFIVTPKETERKLEIDFLTGLFDQLNNYKFCGDVEQETTMKVVRNFTSQKVIFIFYLKICKNFMIIRIFCRDIV